MSRVPLTKEGEILIKEKLSHLKFVERPQISQAIAEARAHGDLKENAEYHAAKELQGLIEAKINEMEIAIANAQVIDVKEIPETGRVVFGSTVTVADLENDKEITYKIVGNLESDPDNGHISIDTPIAKGLVGKFIDDEIANKLIENIIFDPLKKGKLIFDGYPRSLSQAKNLNILLDKSNQKIDFIFFLNVDKETIINRVKKRKILENRSDDQLDVILKRYDTYMATTRPVLDYYSNKSNFKEIDGSLEITEITSKITNILGV